MRIHRVLALVLAALALTMTSAHVLEMPQKLSYSLDLYTLVNRSMYRYFAIVGGMYEALAILVTAALAWRMRDRPGGRAIMVAAIGLALSFLSWLALVEPVNLAIAHGAGWSVPLRLRWEVGHAIGFALALGGFIALATGAVQGGGATAPAPRATVPGGGATIAAQPSRTLR